MIIDNNTLTKAEFDELKKDQNWEVFTENQIKNYTIHVANLIAKSQKNELSEQENKNLTIGKAEISSFQSIKIVENINGHIVKSMVWVTPKQIEFTDTLEKSENGEAIQKGIFLDTDLNRKLGRVGQELIKGCGAKKTDKMDVYKATYNEIIKSGAKGLFDDMKKAHPDMSENDYNMLTKGFETKAEGEETEKKDDSDEGEEVEETDEESEPEEVEKHLQDTINKINDNFTKGLIDEEIYTSAIGQFEDFIQKSRPTKYFKREGAPGSYKYYYTKEDYNRAKGGQQTEIHHGKEKEDGEIKMNNLDWGKTTEERNNNLDKFHSLKTDKEKQDFIRELKSGGKEKEEGEVTTKNIDDLKSENPYTLFNNGGANFNEKYLDHVVLENNHSTIINGVKFTAHSYDNKGKFVFDVQTKDGGKRRNTTQIREKGKSDSSDEVAIGKFQGQDLRNSTKSEYVLFYEGKELKTSKHGAINSNNGIVLSATLPNGESVSWRSNENYGKKGFSVGSGKVSEIRNKLEYKLANKKENSEGGKSKAAQKVLELMDSEEDGQDKYGQYVAQVVKEMGVSKEALEKELDKYI